MIVIFIKFTKSQKNLYVNFSSRKLPNIEFYETFLKEFEKVVFENYFIIIHYIN